MLELSKIAARSPRGSDLIIDSIRMDQPEVCEWLEEELSGRSLQVAMELVSRYFDIAKRLGEPLPMLKRSCLRREARQAVVSIDPKDRWLYELPLGATAGERRDISRVLRALVAESKRVS